MAKSKLNKYSSESDKPVVTEERPVGPPTTKYYPAPEPKASELPVVTRERKIGPPTTRMFPDPVPKVSVSEAAKRYVMTPEEADSFKQYQEKRGFTPVPSATMPINKVPIASAAPASVAQPGEFMFTPEQAERINAVRAAKWYAPIPDHMIRR